MAPGLIAFQFVTASVCGMMNTPNSSPLTSFTVSEMPSSATEPLAAMKRASAFGARNRQARAHYELRSGLARPHLPPSGRPAGERDVARKALQHAERYSRGELESALVRLAELDAAIKGASRLSSELELVRALIDVTAPAEQAAAL